MYPLCWSWRTWIPAETQNLLKGPGWATDTPGRGCVPAPAPQRGCPALTRVAQAADLGAVQPHVLRVRHQADTDPAAVQELHGSSELRAGEGEEAEVERAAGGEEAAHQAAQGGVAARQRARAGLDGRPGLGRLCQQRLDAAGPRGEEQNLPHGPGPPPGRHRQRHRGHRRRRRRRQRRSPRGPHGPARPAQPRRRRERPEGRSGRNAGLGRAPESRHRA